MEKIRLIIRSLVNESFSALSTEELPTHIDMRNKRKLRIFDDTYDSRTNTVRAEIMSGKSKGLFTIANIDDLQPLNGQAMVAEGESGYYPPGAEFDPRAPWNEKDTPHLLPYKINYETNQFECELSNGQTFVVDFIDVLEGYWKSHPNSYQQHEAMFGENDQTMDAETIKYLRDNGEDFEDILMDIASTRDLFSQD